MKKEIKSFVDAFRGLALFFGKEWHAKLHLFFLIVVIGFAMYFKVSAAEWISLLIAFGLVIGTEALNTAIEKLGDIVHPEKLNAMRNVKDIAAGAVMFCVLIAIAIGLIIFIPKIL